MLENTSKECNTVAAMVMGRVDKFSFIVSPDVSQFGYQVGRDDERVGNVMIASHFEIIPTFPVEMGHFIPVPHCFTFNEDMKDVCDHPSCLNVKDCKLHNCFLCDMYVIFADLLN